MKLINAEIHTQGELPMTFDLNYCVKCKHSPCTCLDTLRQKTIENTQRLWENWRQYVKILDKEIIMCDKLTKPTIGESSGLAGYKRVAWSRSMSEEVIGSLWCIVAILAYGFDVTWLMWAAGLKAGSDQLISIYFAAKEIGFVERERAKHESL